MTSLRLLISRGRRLYVACPHKDALGRIRGTSQSVGVPGRVLPPYVLALSPALKDLHVYQYRHPLRAVSVQDGVQDLVHPGHHDPLEKAGHLLGLFLRALEDQVIAASNHEPGVQVLGEPLEEAYALRDLRVRPRSSWTVGAYRTSTPSRSTTPSSPKVSTPPATFSGRSTSGGGALSSSRRSLGTPRQ
jgi:hypothetical protein